MNIIKEVFAEIISMARGTARRLNPLRLLGSRRKPQTISSSGPAAARPVPRSRKRADVEPLDPVYPDSTSPLKPKKEPFKLRRGRPKFAIRAKQLDRTNSISGKILDPLSDPTYRLRLPGFLVRQVSKGRGIPLFGKRIGRIADEGLKFPHIFARELRLPRLISKLLMIPGKLPLIGRIFVRIAQGSIRTWDFRRGVTRMKLVLYSGSIAIVLIFVIVVQFPLTTNPVFCGSCHTMRPQFYNWKDSSHARVTCYACHVSPGLWWLTRDHLVDGPMGLVFEAEIGLQGFKWNDSTSLNSTSHAAQVGIKSARCLRCHDMATRTVTPTKGIKIDHMKHLRHNIACTWCHNRITHWRVANHENFMSGQACFRCHYQSPEGADKLGNGAPRPTPEQLAMGLGLPFEAGHEEEAAGGHGEEAAGPGEEAGHQEEGEGHGESKYVEPQRYTTEDTSGEFTTPEMKAEQGLNGEFGPGSLAASQGHGRLNEPIREAYHAHTPVGETAKETALSLPVIGLPEVHIDFTKYAASSACNVCHVRGRL